MRNRFFFIILTALACAAVGISLVHAKFFKSQRLKLIDRQIAESSRALLDSEMFPAVLSSPERIESAITDVLQGARIGKVFVLKDAEDTILYQSFNVSLLKSDLPTAPEWVTVNTESEYVRVRNLPMRGGKTLQVGLVLDRNFLDWEIIDSSVVNYIIGLVLSLFIASVFLTIVLLSPLRLLIAHLGETTVKLTNLKDVRPLPSQLTRYARGFWSKSDEFAQLLSAIQRLIDRINLNYKLTRSWTFQMAHELKTPLAIMRSQTETALVTKEIERPLAADITREIDQMSRIIGDFLDWAELENSVLQRDLHALRFKPVIESVTARLQSISDGRIRLKINNDFSVIANPIHLDQLITNLLTNALKFSPPDQPVEVEVKDRSFVVRDQGPGFTDEVLERLGQPFNVGPSRAGNGLGLAWVSAVSKLYQWQFSVQPEAAGGEVRVVFPHTVAT